MVIIMIGSEDVTKKDVMKRGVLRKKRSRETKNTKAKGDNGRESFGFFKRKSFSIFWKAKTEKMYPLKNNLKYVLLRMKSFKGTTVVLLPPGFARVLNLS